VIWITWRAAHWRTIPLCGMGVTVNSCHATPRDCCGRADSMVVFNWAKRPSNALRKRRTEDAARRLSDTSSDHLPDRPSLDGYTMREIPPDQVPQLFKSKRGTA
jgi:hypothetical protein